MIIISFTILLVFELDEVFHLIEIKRCVLSCNIILFSIAIFDLLAHDSETQHRLFTRFDLFLFNAHLFYLLSAYCLLLLYNHIQWNIFALHFLHSSDIDTIVNMENTWNIENWIQSTLEWYIFIFILLAKCNWTFLASNIILQLMLLTKCDNKNYNLIGGAINLCIFIIYTRNICAYKYTHLRIW